MRTLLLILFSLLSFSVYSQKLTIDIEGIRNTKGVINLSVYKDQTSFEKEIPFRIYELSKENIKNGHLNLCIDNLEAGTYGIALVDDENGNHKIDYKFFIPNEGFGFSNFPFKEMRKPDFNSFSFLLPDSGANIHFEMYYMHH